MLLPGGAFCRVCLPLLLPAIAIDTNAVDTNAVDTAHAMVLRCGAYGIERRLLRALGFEATS